jgi:serine/threonine-protein kinase
LVRPALHGPDLCLSSNGSTVDLAPVILDTIVQTIGPVPRVLLRETASGEEHGPVVQIDAETNASVRYRIAGEIARGGMGAILKGRDPNLNRDVALKVLLEELRGRPEAVCRFVEEAQIGGQLQHPGIVPVYELGTFADRRPFFCMKLVKGQTLAALLAARKDPVTELPRFLAIFEAVCQTMAYAHARGVIHRDLKPSNVMVGAFGEVQVMDWGLAKVLPRGTVANEAERDKVADTLVVTARSGPEDADLSHTGSVLGTPSYMAPEQARGEIDQINERADVFALGSILCETLAGRPAFLGRSAGEIQRKAALGDTADAFAELDASRADAELVALAKDCLAREAQDRPRDAGLVAARMTAYLVGVQERVKAAERDRAVAEAKALEERKRRKLQIGLAGCLMALVAAGGLGATYSLQHRADRDAVVARVLHEVSTLREVALRQPEDLGRWESAFAAVRQADTALGPTRDPATHRHLAALREAVQQGAEAARRDRTLLEALADVRSGKQDLGPAGADAAYGRAFREADLDLDRLTPTDVGSRLKSRPVSVAQAAAAALDDWALVRRSHGSNETRWHLPLEAARAADPDRFRDQVRTAVLAGDDSALKAIAADPKARELSPASTVLLAEALEDHAAAAALLRTAAGRHPDDIWVNYNLAVHLDRLAPPQRDEQVRYLSAARAVRPETAHDLAHLLEAMGRVDEALAVFADLTARRPTDLAHLACYGRSLRDHGRPDAGEILERAAAAGRAAIRLRPEVASAHCQLGLAVAALGHLAEAITEFRTAVQIEPNLATAHYYLGNALAEQGHHQEAMAEYRSAIRLQPDFAGAHQNLGNALKVQGQLEEALAEYRAAIRHQPGDALAHRNLAVALAAQGHRQEAIAELGAAIRLNPRDEAAHYNLGTALWHEGHLEEAIEAYRTALRIRPEFAEVHCNLGLALQRAGDYRGALEALRKGHELGSRRPRWGYPSAQWIQQVEAQVDLAERLSAVLRGDRQPRDQGDRVALARMAYNTKRFAGAARLWSEALDAELSLGDDRQAQHRYNAACAAALAATPRSKDVPPSDEESRTKLRAQALGWLRAELTAWSKRAEAGDPKTRIEVATTLKHWQSDADLSGVRDAPALDRLPEVECAEWRALWKEVDTLRQQTEKTP